MKQVIIIIIILAAILVPFTIANYWWNIVRYVDEVTGANKPRPIKYCNEQYPGQGDTWDKGMILNNEKGCFELLVKGFIRLK